VQPYEGQIKSIKVDKCGLQPGSCQGSVILAKKAGGEEVTLAINPGTWLKRGDQLVTIDELGIGNYVKVEAVQLPGQQLQQITVLSVGRED
jgi:urease accessory protein UreE